MKLKNLLIRCFAISLLAILLSTVYSPEYSAYAAESTIYTKDGGAVIQAEETEWKYRVLDGKLQRRLWSITYARWLTDWEWV
ncbi:MAG: hypothetical protein VB128_10100 [Sedimentibacter saalensis]|jgi:hypothetical protein|uniref:hypothetical protein n=1 Tax=Sedimentibacter saalensis TaxID=130788 RepID=UPI002B1F9978|nr:hypothetical protein [Sedimentibacter saalensis]MEA5095296.1 hypothetical protein [Sedimentibacter saalensis]